MLHILWMILKIILIVLGILLGLLVLALFLLLFCPVRYGAEASGNLKEWKKAEACVSVSWLFRGIMVKFWLKDGGAAQSIRVFGIPLEKLLHKGRRDKKQKAAQPKKKPEEGRKPLPADTAKKAPENAPAKIEPAKQEEIPNTEKEAEAELPVQEDGEELSEEKIQKEPGTFVRIRNKISSFLDKLRKIPEAVRNFTSKLQGIYDKINHWKQFLSHPRVKEAFAFAWQHIKRLLKHVFPTRIEGHVTFGSEDPSITGAVLAVLGITMGFHKNDIEIDPVFEGNNLLYGDVKLRGRVYGFMVVKTALQIYFNKNIKYVINRWKHKEESL